VGKRRLEEAILENAGRFEVTITWRPFQLRPNNPPEGVLKSPDTPDNPRVGARMKQAGAAVGIDFTGKCDRSPNTLLTHVLMAHALTTTGSNNELAEAMFRGYFTDGVFPDVDNLVKAAAAAGMDADAARQVLTDDAAIAAVQNELATWRAYTSSVPHFIVNGVPAFSGAQGKEAFVQAFDAAR
jgi:predicted DsbA family dithiol-disulfide isomerase